MQTGASTTRPNPRSLYDETADARAAIRNALAEADRDGKRVIVDFGADWCPDCHALAAYLDGPRGRELVDSSFVVVSVDVGYWDNNLDVVKDYGDAIWNGIPALVALEPDGTIVGSSKDGSLASASRMSETEVLDYIERWAP